MRLRGLAYQRRVGVWNCCARPLQQVQSSKGRGEHGGVNIPRPYHVLDSSLDSSRKCQSKVEEGNFAVV